MKSIVYMVVIFVRNSAICGMSNFGAEFYYGHSAPLPHGNFPSAEFRNLSATKCIMIQADLNLCCKNIDQTFAVLFVEVAFVLIVVLHMLFVCICVFC